MKVLAEKRGMTEEERERLARAWTDRGADEEETAGTAPARETYRDGSLISECWSDREA